MIVPQFWAEARAPAGRITLRRFGWSDESQEAAQAHAEQRVHEAVAEAARERSPRRRDLKLAYGGAFGLPIREEIVGRHGSSVITRNGYGARCLNTPDVLFVDIDFPSAGLGNASRFGIHAVLIVAAIAIGVVAKSAWAAVVAVIVAMIVGGVAIPMLNRASQRNKTPPEDAVRSRIDAFLATRTDWRVRLYRTPAGFRLLALHRRFDATNAETQACMSELGADPIYAQMCLRQRCFRARVSPKPWRIGIVEHLPPRPGVWPVRPERLPERQRWVDDYERKAEGFAACRFVVELGSGSIDRDAEQVCRLHDELTRAESNMPIA